MSGAPVRAPEGGAEMEGTSGGRRPAHYAGDGRMTCADAVRSMRAGAAAGLPPMALWRWGAALKYLWRWSRKGGADDLDKARRCIDLLEAEAGRGGGAGRDEAVGCVAALGYAAVSVALSVATGLACGAARGFLVLAALAAIGTAALALAMMG